MVKIISFKTNQSEEGKEFCTLMVQGGIEAVKSKKTGRTYLTARKASVPCTFTKEVCETLIGTDLEGSVKRIEVEPYEYTVEETGEVIELTHRYEYLDDSSTIIQQNVIEAQEVF